jgi:heme oxygenase
VAQRQPHPGEAALDVTARLRAGTASAHRLLEHDLDLLRPPLSQTRFSHLLQRFWGFHLIWEAALGRHADLAEVWARRSRLELLRRDLLALGLSESEIEALPRCAAAADLATSPVAALGSIYVLEGSTLGGQLITRALEGCDWLPPCGLRYFDPYRGETGLMWRRFQAHLRSASTPADPVIERAAAQTFELLRRWLTAPAG